MALKSTVYKAELNVADMDRHHYHDYHLTLACHPSETEERLMLRLLAFALYADPALTFGKGLSCDDEPDLWQKDLTGKILRWVALGLPDEKHIRRAAGLSEQIVILSYGGQAAKMWWTNNQKAFKKLQHLTVLYIEPEDSTRLANLSDRSMKLSVGLEDGNIMISTDQESFEIHVEHWQ